MKTKILPVLLVITRANCLWLYIFLPISWKTIENFDAVKAEIAQMQLETEEILEIDLNEEYVIMPLYISP